MRDDLLQRVDHGALLLRRRRILLDQSVLQSFNLSWTAPAKLASGIQHERRINAAVFEAHL